MYGYIMYITRLIMGLFIDIKRFFRKLINKIRFAKPLNIEKIKPDRFNYK